MRLGVVRRRGYDDRDFGFIRTLIVKVDGTAKVNWNERAIWTTAHRRAAVSGTGFGTPSRSRLVVALYHDGRFVCDGSNKRRRTMHRGFFSVRRRSATSAWRPFMSSIRKPSIAYAKASSLPPDRRLCHGGGCGGWAHGGGCGCALMSAGCGCAHVGGCAGQGCRGVRWRLWMQRLRRLRRRMRWRLLYVDCRCPRLLRRGCKPRRSVFDLIRYRHNDDAAVRCGFV